MPFIPYQSTAHNVQKDRQTDKPNTLMFSNFVEKRKNHGIQLKIRFQTFLSMVRDISEIFHVILYMKKTFVHLSEMPSYHYI